MRSLVALFLLLLLCLASAFAQEGSGPAFNIEVRAPGYETLDFEVRISPEHTTTYTGELKRVQ